MQVTIIRWATFKELAVWSYWQWIWNCILFDEYIKKSCFFLINFQLDLVFCFSLQVEVWDYILKIISLFLHWIILLISFTSQCIYLFTCYLVTFNIMTHLIFHESNMTIWKTITKTRCNFYADRCIQADKLFVVWNGKICICVCLHYVCYTSKLCFHHCPKHYSIVCLISSLSWRLTTIF